MAAGGAVAFLGGAVDAASDLNESVNKANVVFGDASEKVMEFGNTAADSIGMSKQAAVEAAGTFGNLLRALGNTEDTSASMSIRLVQLASDLASFNNMEVGDVLNRLRSGLLGEQEAVERLGISLSETGLKQRAFDMGLVDSTKGVLPPAIRTQAAFAEMLAQTSLAQGDFARTSDQLANTQRINAAKWDDAMAKIGDALLPVVTSIAELAGHVIPLLADAINLVLLPVRALSDAFATAGEVTDNFALDFGDMGDRIHKIADQAGEDFQAVKDFIREDMQATGHSFEEAAEAADEHFGTISDATDDLVEQSGQAWDTYQSQIASSGDAAAEAVRGFQGTILEAMEQGRVHVVDVALRTPGDIADALEAGRSAVAAAAQDLKDAMEGELDPIDEIAALQGQLAGEDLAAGLKSKDPIVRLRAQELYQTIQNRLSQLGAYSWGSNIAKAWADGLASRWGYAHAKAVYLGTAVSGPLEGYSPPKEGPLKDIDKWGANVGQAWADGLTSAANAGIVNLASPSLPPMSMAGAIPGVAAGTSIVYELNVNGVQRTVDSAEQAIDELNAMGAFSEGRL